ncbi:MAG TPA: putative baseplate assembly protein [Desulfatiglandales bacterium]|nr:putative baseplate assembly protein [Desulfatiglandales bacterium]
MGLPIPKLADRTFEEIVKEARALISRYAPEWTDHNLHDPGITFLELFAWIAEMQMYYLDRLTANHYRKFLEIAGFSLHGRQPAKVALTFSDVIAETQVPSCTQIVALIGGDQVPFETEEKVILIPVNLKSVKTVLGSEILDRTEANAQDGIIFPAFGEMPEEGSAFQLGFDKALPSGDIALTIFIFEDDLPAAAMHGEEDPHVIQSVETVWEYREGGSWLPLIVKNDGTKVLTRSGRVIIEGPPAMEQIDGLFWIRCRLAAGTFEIAPLVDSILMNTVTAVQIETVRNEDLGRGDCKPGQKKIIGKPPVYHGSQAVEIAQKSGAWEAWEKVDDFEVSGPQDRHYQIDYETGEIFFGNGLNGRIPGTCDQIRVSYKTTLGSKGNISKGQQFIIAASGFSLVSVTNEKKASGGQDEESIESAQARARRDLSTQYRAITATDFETVALSTPGLRMARAKAITNYNPLYPCVLDFPNWITVVVVPVTRGTSPTPQPSPGFIETAESHLNLHRLVTTGVSVVAPKYVKISVSCMVKVRKRSSPSAITALATEALNLFLDPLKGGPDGDGWPFGRPVYPSEIYQVVDAVEGVDYVTGVSISAEGEYQQKEGIIKIPPVSLVYSGEHRITANE